MVSSLMMGVEENTSILLCKLATIEHAYAYTTSMLMGEKWLEQSSPLCHRNIDSKGSSTAENGTEMF